MSQHIDAGNLEKNAHDEIMSTIRESGLESFATEIGGIIQNGSIPSLNPGLDSIPDEHQEKNAETIEKDNVEINLTPTSNMSSHETRKRRTNMEKNEEDIEDGKGKKKRVRGGAGASDFSPTKESETKSSKGLRHFSMKVCKKVEEKGQTTYNEVADELVNEFLHMSPAESGHTSSTGKPAFDEKNIRRRVYDALNVLLAMDIVSKEKKEIRWRGLPTNAQHERDALEREKARLESVINKKREQLGHLMEQQVTYHNLVKRNLCMERSDGTALAQPALSVTNSSSSSFSNEETAEGRLTPTSSSTILAPETPIAPLDGAAMTNDPTGITATPKGWTEHTIINTETTDSAPTPSYSNSVIDNEAQTKVALPFIVITTGVDTMVQCEMTECRNQVSFQFSDTFEINDDAEVLKRLGLHQSTEEELKRLFPPRFMPYLPDSAYLPSSTPSASLTSSSTYPQSKEEMNSL